MAEERARAMRAVDVAMRADGFVTAQEVASVLGTTLRHVHTQIERKTIPGKIVETPGSQVKRWYVDIRRLCAEYPTNGPTTIRRALRELLKVVSVPRESAAR